MKFIQNISKKGVKKLAQIGICAATLIYFLPMPGTCQAIATEPVPVQAGTPFVPLVDGFFFNNQQYDAVYNMWSFLIDTTNVYGMEAEILRNFSETLDEQTALTGELGKAAQTHSALTIQHGQQMKANLAQVHDLLRQIEVSRLDLYERQKNLESSIKAANREQKHERFWRNAAIALGIGTAAYFSGRFL